MNAEAAQGVEVRPDLTGVSLLIGAPSLTSKYDGHYLKSFMNTVTAVRQYGGKIDWAQLPYCADPSFARARLFGTFYRSDHTHFLSIDDDIGWYWGDVVQMLMFKREFIAAAGPKKIPPPRPLEFAMTLRKDDGTVMPLHQEPDTGLMRVSRVGGAFVMIQRSVAQEMTSEHPELKFQMDDGTTEWALYTPMVVNGVYLSEDYAFCQRWQKIGGDIFVLPNARLKHSGCHVWEGALMDTFFEAAEAANGNR
jgi:hypothetical protein